MAKEWILNSATNRFQFNFKRTVGPTSESIRKCSPKTVDEWREYYYKNVRTEEQIEEIGRRLYVKITEVIHYEVESITEDDCIQFIKELVIDRTFAGYTTEIQTIYGQLQEEITLPIEPAPDEWDRGYNVDFFIKVNEKYIGLQIKPINKNVQIAEIYKEYVIQHKTQELFTRTFGGKVFYIFSHKEGDKKVIVNREVIDEIRDEITRLKELK